MIDNIIHLYKNEIKPKRKQDFLEFAAKEMGSTPAYIKSLFNDRSRLIEKHQEPLLNLLQSWIIQETENTLKQIK